MTEKAKTAVFFTTDYGFLIPTVVVALQIRAQIQGDNETDILIFLVDFLEAETRTLNAEFAAHDIQFIDMQSSAYEDAGTYYHKSHIPKSTLARLCVSAMIPAQYEDLIYMDGDIQIVGDISRLLKWKVRPGYVLAVLDQGLLELGEPGSSVSRFYTTYTAALGLKHPFEYFNAGVLAFQRSTLLAKGPEALRYFHENSEKCTQHDQSALNAVFKGCREYLSPRYNFMTKFQAIGAESFVHPVVIHFADMHKPWHEPVKPWLTQYAGIYGEMIKKYPVLANYVPYLKTQARASSYQPGLLKTAALTVASPVRRLLRRRNFRKYLAKTPFAFE
jgi:lipopolysaccharide biosynthesis glycosyltransferase